MSNELPGGEAIFRRQILDHLKAAGRGGLTARELEGRLAGSVSRSALGAALEELQADGLAAEWSGRWRAVEATDRIAGTLQRLERGDALVRTGAAGEAGYLVRRKNLGGAIDGDMVLVRRVTTRGRRATGALPEASVVQVLARRWQELVGRLEEGEGPRPLVPFDPKCPLAVRVADARDLSPREFVVVRLEPDAGAGGRLQGKIVEVLGDPREPGVDVTIVLRHFRIPERFPRAVLAAAANLPEDPGPADREGRLDLTDRVTVTIDGASARDFDDAISVQRRENGGFELGVHIADVSHYVPEGGALDLEAYRRGTSVYYPERAIPMLPEALSNGLCSLRPERPRLTLSAFLEIGADGEVRSRRFAESVIRSHRRLTYDEVRRLLEAPEDGDAQAYGEVLPLLRDAERLTRILLAARARRGSIDFDLPEGDVVLDTDGYMVGVQPGSRHIAHRMIEEFMIAANQAVAQELEAHAAPALFRVHDAPDRLALENLRELLKTFGLRLAGELESLHPRALQAVLAEVAGRPEEGLISALVLRTMQRARYDPACLGHYALATRYYTHFTSPIRRYPDLLVHRRLKAVLQGRAEEEAAATLLPERLPAIAAHSSATERRAERSERDLLQWKKVRFLAARTGETFAGRVSGVQPFGLFVQLEEYLVDGLIPISHLTDDYYVFEPAEHRLRGTQSGRSFRLGDPLQVRLEGIDELQRGLRLVPSDLPPAPRRGRRAGQPERSARGAGRRRPGRRARDS